VVFLFRRWTVEPVEPDDRVKTEACPEGRGRVAPESIQEQWEFYIVPHESHEAHDSRKCHQLVLYNKAAAVHHAKESP